MPSDLKYLSCSVDDDLTAAARSLTGDIMQLPPMYSAIKVRGQKLCNMARAGEEVERAARPVSVPVFSVRRHAQDPRQVHFRIVCSKGTYVRSLVHSLVGSLASQRRVFVWASV